MRAPKKLYLVLSKRAKGDVLDNRRDIWEKPTEAKAEVTARNGRKMGGTDDWRYDTYVKGD